MGSLLSPNLFRLTLVTGKLQTTGRQFSLREISATQGRGEVRNDKSAFGDVSGKSSNGLCGLGAG